ncbi:hypothetical protein [uncultured Thiohalocapsa sp.]|uniref:hypothetical protein n=1 Tax=uncultured Thiohalocapsa sp. TaxID=768990 RepID=UPI0025FED229|nr:hypothetical protein [uncultured Thiohalocapsa sp.]
MKDDPLPERMQHCPFPGGPNCRCSQYGAARFSFIAENLTKALIETGWDITAAFPVVSEGANSIHQVNGS